MFVVGAALTSSLDLSSFVPTVTRGWRQRARERRVVRGVQMRVGTSFGSAMTLIGWWMWQRFLTAAKRQALPGQGVCVPLSQLLQTLREHQCALPTAEDVPLEPKEFMNSKKSHEVQIMSEVVSSLTQRCRVRQVIDVGSGKGYLCSFLSLQHGLEVYGIDSSSTNTHGGAGEEQKATEHLLPWHLRSTRPGGPRVMSCPQVWAAVGSDPESPFPFLGGLSLELERPTPERPPALLSPQERERKKRENLERKGRGCRDHCLYSPPLTSYVTRPHGAAMLCWWACIHVVTWPPTRCACLQAKPELRAVCSVGCCYHLLSEEFDPSGTHKPHNPSVTECPNNQWGFPMSKHLRNHAWFCGRNARMSACLISDGLVQGYHEKYRPRRKEMEAFNRLKVSLAPCIEGLILLDRLCYLKEQENTSFSAVVQLFDPLMSPAMLRNRRHKEMKHRPAELVLMDSAD
ncbi:hypothetical protein SKAU_G00042210 [Synaphobranchus kaupii]|uniref:Methyltransferase domain-containing protein n=1 Tax=Synaphobranchus kaupii TaxID=118154 RepID=A0A9Q1G257_SYNKA|nr:hypothetical protein SKAU_G00042210 [Synaphobranchus kaupii]